MFNLRCSVFTLSHLVLYVYCVQCTACVCVCAHARVILGVSRRGVSPTQSAESLDIRTRVSTINCPQCLGRGCTVELQGNSSHACKALKHRIETPSLLLLILILLLLIILLILLFFFFCFNPKYLAF